MAGWSAAPTSGTLVGFIRRGFPSGTWWLQGPNKNHRIKLSKARFLVGDVIFFCLSPIFFKLVIAYSSPQKDARTYLLFMVVRWCFPHNFQYIYTYIYFQYIYIHIYIYTQIICIQINCILFCPGVAIFQTPPFLFEAPGFHLRKHCSGPISSGGQICWR